MTARSRRRSFDAMPGSRLLTLTVGMDDFAPEPLLAQFEKLLVGGRTLQMALETNPPAPAAMVARAATRRGAGAGAGASARNRAGAPKTARVRA